MSEKHWSERSLIDGLIIGVAQAVATTVAAWGTDAFTAVLIAQLSGLTLGILALVRRQRVDPSSRVEPPTGTQR